MTIDRTSLRKMTSVMLTEDDLERVELIRQKSGWSKLTDVIRFALFETARGYGAIDGSKIPPRDPSIVRITCRKKHVFEAKSPTAPCPECHRLRLAAAAAAAANSPAPSSSSSSELRLVQAAAVPSTPAPSPAPAPAPAPAVSTPAVSQVQPKLTYRCSICDTKFSCAAGEEPVCPKCEE